MSHILTWVRPTCLSAPKCSPLFFPLSHIFEHDHLISFLPLYFLQSSGDWHGWWFSNFDILKILMRERPYCSLRWLSFCKIEGLQCRVCFMVEMTTSPKAELVLLMSVSSPLYVALLPISSSYHRHWDLPSSCQPSIPPALDEAY